MSSVNSSFSDYFTGRKVGTELSSGNYFSLKVLCIPRSAQCSLSTGGQAEDEAGETELCELLFDALLS